MARKRKNSMKNYRILLVVNCLFFAAVGIMMPLQSLYLQELGADLALISLILTSSVVVALGGNFAWGWLADRTGRRKPFYIAGLAGAAAGYLWLSQAPSVAMAWPAVLLNGLGFAAVFTLGLTLAGDTLDTSSRKGRGIGLYRGLGSLAWAAGAFGQRTHRRSVLHLGRLPGLQRPAGRRCASSRCCCATSKWQHGRLRAAPGGCPAAGRAAAALSRRRDDLDRRRLRFEHDVAELYGLIWLQQDGDRESVVVGRLL